ncbi:YbaB/EbfC family nucleoid-associated protein [Plantactinospora sp. WMMB782]|uniref:YbaB/EbfC family nucleoid-associated protein n=1 Tax=Plantactinospora sp. WMMB782 TaxID=3404121 RepID=UPI003B965B4C
MFGPQPGGGGILDPDGAMEHLAAWKGRIDRLAADTRTMSDRLQQLRVTATSADRMAEVTIDHTGALLELRLDQRIQRVAPEAVARVIMSTIADARRKAAAQAREILADTVGTDSPAARAIAARVDQQLRDLQTGESTPDRDPNRW